MLVQISFIISAVTIYGNEPKDLYQSIVFPLVSIIYSGLFVLSYAGFIYQITHSDKHGNLKKGL